MDEEQIAEVEDVDETTQETEEEQVLGRDLVLEEIANKHKANRGQEIELEVEEPEEEELEEPAEEFSGLVDLKVDGEIIQKTAEEVEAAGGINAYQMTLAADKRFKEAAAEKATLATMRADLQRKEQELLQQQTEIKEPVKLSEEKVDELFANIYSGDEEKAKESFMSVMSGLQNQPQHQAPQVVNKQEIVNETVYKLDQDRGVEQFTKEYHHLDSDPKLRDMVNEATIRIKKATPNKKPSVIIIEAAKEIDSWVNSFSPDTENLLEEQVVKKKSLNPIKTAKTRMKQDVGYKPKTQAEIFADQKANRSR